MAILERLSESEGTVLIGWVAAGVLYARFENTVGEALAARFADRFTSLIGDSVKVVYFVDSSPVTSYELRAAALVMEVTLARRQQIVAMVARPWAGAMGSKAQDYADSFGSVEYVTTAAEFDARLSELAPNPALAFMLRDPCAEAAAGPTTAPRASSAWPATGTPGNGVAYTYVFDLSDFERGRFCATRFKHLSLRPRGAWSCQARDDQHALELARRAALVEWARPTTRRPEDFSVKFVGWRAARERRLDKQR
jgi:hypothetical protein